MARSFCISASATIKPRLARLAQTDPGKLRQTQADPDKPRKPRQAQTGPGRPRAPSRLSQAQADPDRSFTF